MIIRAMLVVALLMTAMQAAVNHRQSDTTDFMQGSVDVVISTRDGFVLATDSRLTHRFESQITYTDDTQKLFPVGTRSACVIAGLIGSGVGTGVLRPEDAVGATFVALDRYALYHPVTADDIATDFYFSLQRVGELVLSRQELHRQVGELEVVSVTQDGAFQWISLGVALEPTLTPAGTRLSISKPTYSTRASGSRLRFGYSVIGQQSVVSRLLEARRPIHDQHSQSLIMKRYYTLKRAAKLDQLTLNEGISLARELVQATIDLAPQSAGVGGPIDIATVTKSGFHCVQQKCRVARLHSTKLTVTNSTFGPYQQDLDNLQCINCDFTDTHMSFAGTGEVQLLNSKFGGRCQLLIASTAKRNRPEIVEALQKEIGQKCDQVVQEADHK
jgi:20S proteasome alpha/beta subunit